MSEIQMNATLQAFREVAADTKAETRAEQLSAKEGMQDALERLTRHLGEKVDKKRKKERAQLKRIGQALKSGEKAERVTTLKVVQRKAEEFERKNPELKAKTLALLRDRIEPDDSPDLILKKTKEFYPDPSLADEALEFLEETTEGETGKNVRESREEHFENNEREIVAGRNISELAREAEGLGTPTSLRDLYRDITGNPREPVVLFEQLATRYKFEDLKNVIQFLLHSMGADLKAKGPSIPRAYLQRLVTETRSLQAILGVYRFFNGRMELMKKRFAREGMKMPRRLTFELMAKQFMALAKERYPSSQKVKDVATRLGIEKWVAAKIIVLEQMRDAVRQVAKDQVYKSIPHRDELHDAIIKALEDLEDEFEELEEEGEA